MNTIFQKMVARLLLKCPPKNKEQIKWAIPACLVIVLVFTSILRLVPAPIAATPEEKPWEKLPIVRDLSSPSKRLEGRGEIGAWSANGRPFRPAFNVFCVIVASVSLLVEQTVNTFDTEVEGGVR